MSSRTKKKRTTTTTFITTTVDKEEEEMDATEQTSNISYDDPPIHNGIPPWPSTFLVGFLLALSTTSLPTIESLDNVATTSTFCHRIFPQYISLQMLGYTRLLIGLCAWSLTIHLATVSPGWDVNPHYKPQSRLRRRLIKLRGIRTMCPFTSWCWFMLGTSFVLNGIIALLCANHDGESYSDGRSNTDNNIIIIVQPWMLRMALILWELSAPLSLLVSAVIRWAIWPVVEASGRPHKLACFRNQMQHNMNSILTLAEAALLGGIPIIPTHLALSTLVGVVYIIFSWIMGGGNLYGEKDDGPQYLYWFFDVTLGKTTTIALVALLFALTASFGVFVGVEIIIQKLGGTLVTNLIIAASISGLVCRFRPSKPQNVTTD
jgi:hypothetical protein